MATTSRGLAAGPCSAAMGTGGSVDGAGTAHSLGSESHGRVRRLFARPCNHNRVSGRAGGTAGWLLLPTARAGAAADEQGKPRQNTANPRRAKHFMGIGLQGAYQRSASTSASVISSSTGGVRQHEKPAKSLYSTQSTHLTNSCYPKHLAVGGMRPNNAPYPARIAACPKTASLSRYVQKI